MFADFLTVIPQTPSMVLITYRPEYGGALTRIHGAQTIALAPLSDSESSALLDELLGPDPSVAAVRALIADRAAGNPFSPRRSCANSPNAACSMAIVVPMPAAQT